MSKEIKRIDDLSYSNLVSLIQHDEMIGADVIDSIAKELEDNAWIKEKLEQKLANVNGRRTSLINSIDSVVQHLKKEYPLIVSREGYVIVVSEKSIKIERNVLQSKKTQDNENNK